MREPIPYIGLIVAWATPVAFGVRPITATWILAVNLLWKAYMSLAYSEWYAKKAADLHQSLQDLRNYFSK